MDSAKANKKENTCTYPPKQRGLKGSHSSQVSETRETHA